MLYQLSFESCAVPEGNLLGPRGEGFRQFLQILDGGRISVAAMGVGLAQGAYDLAADYARERTQFGQPIGRFQALQHGLAETATKLLAARLLVRHVAELLDEGAPAPAEASMAKLFATETAKEAALQGMQFMGGMGYSMESEMQSYVRDSLVLTIFGGTSQIQKNIIAGQLGLNG